MATKVHCAYCFECLDSAFTKRPYLHLDQIQRLWIEYSAQSDKNSAETSDNQLVDKSTETTDNQLVDKSTETTDNQPIDKSTETIDNQPVDNAQPSQEPISEEEHPLFVTWNTLSSESEASLRGCIGTFEDQPLSKGLKNYTLTSAFQDHRFSPINAYELPKLQASVTLLTDFSSWTEDILGWEIGKHGIRIAFEDKGRKYGATYLPHVASDQNWNQEHTIQSLMHKAGWHGKPENWKEVGGMKIQTYEGRHVEMNYQEWRAFKDWTDKKGETGEEVHDASVLK